MDFMSDGFWIGVGIAAAGYFIAAAVGELAQSRLHFEIDAPSVAKLAEAMRYAAKSARGGVRAKLLPPTPPDPREAPMLAWLSRHPEVGGIEAENLMATWHIAVGISPSDDKDKSDAIGTLKVYGAPLPSDLTA